jgi:hypothetical protein
MGVQSDADWPTEYKVLTQKDKWFSGKFDPVALEEAVNAYAEDGWRICQSATASFPGFFSSNREEIIVVLQRSDSARTYEYKVLTQKDKWLSAKFDPAALEDAMNAYAEEGWRVASAVTASFPGFFSSNREEMIIFLERPA